MKRFRTKNKAGLQARLLDYAYRLSTVQPKQSGEVSWNRENQPPPRSCTASTRPWRHRSRQDAPDDTGAEPLWAPLLGRNFDAFLLDGCKERRTRMARL